MFAKNYLAGPQTICTEMLNSVKLQKKTNFLNTVKPNFSVLMNLSKTIGLWSEKKTFQGTNKDIQASSLQKLR